MCEEQIPIPKDMKSCPHLLTESLTLGKFETSRNTDAVIFENVIIVSTAAAKDSLKQNQNIGRAISEFANNQAVSLFAGWFLLTCESGLDAAMAFAKSEMERFNIDFLGRESVKDEQLPELSLSEFDFLSNVGDRNSRVHLVERSAQAVASANFGGERGFEGFGFGGFSGGGGGGGGFVGGGGGGVGGGGKRGGGISRIYTSTARNLVRYQPERKAAASRFLMELCTTPGKNRDESFGFLFVFLALLVCFVLFCFVLFCFVLFCFVWFVVLFYLVTVKVAAILPLTPHRCAARLVVLRAANFSRKAPAMPCQFLQRRLHRLKETNC